MPRNELMKADGRCLDAAERFLDSLADHPSPMGLARLEEALETARSLAEAEQPADRFEELFLRHLRAGWSLTETVARYRYTWPRMPVAELVEALAGEGAVERLEAYVAELDPEEIWEYLEARHGYRTDRLPAGAADVRPHVERKAKETVEAFRAWLAGNGWDLPGLDAEVVVGEGDSTRSWYQPAEHRVMLGGGEFLVFRRDDAVTVNPVIALQALAHELAGHAVQNALSRNLPDPLRPDVRPRLRFAALPLAEGFAEHAGSLAVAFAEDAGSELGLDAGDVAFLRRLVRLTPMHHAVPALVAVLAVRKRQEPAFDPVAHLAALCGHDGFGELVDDAEREPVYKILYECAAFFGILEVRGVASELERLGIAGAEVWSALGTGAWALPCYREAVLGPSERDGSAASPRRP